MAIIAGSAQVTGSKAPDLPLNKTFVLWVGIFTIVAIVIIFIVDIVMYIKRFGLFADYKAQPTALDNVYYPNGKPDPTTGKPKDSTKIPNGLQIIC